MREHRMRNRMVALRSLTGDMLVTQDDIKEEIPELKKGDLITGVTEGEIKNAIFGMGLNRAPGLDGFTVEFYQHCWPVIVVKYFFATGEAFPAFNTTVLSLIPKTKFPVNIKEYRPIACCNVIYKCIIKILADRLKRVLNDVISYNQSAFVKGRMLNDSVLLMNELVNNYHNKEGRRRCTLKIDIMKAYDTVRWDYLWCVIEAMRFPVLFNSWTRKCVSISIFSVQVNGSLHGQFESSRGLRQGDLVSPYLFLIVMEGLTGILRKEPEEGNIDFYLGCKELKILNIMFADDMFVMSAANVKFITTIEGVLNRFGKIVGLSPNLEKSSFYVAGTPDEVVRRLKDVIGIPMAVLPVKYLGLPLTTKKFLASECNGLIEKEIDSVLKQFVWGWESEKNKAKVNWSDVCLPRKEGGLGLKDLCSVWGYKLKSTDGWIWKKLLKDRDWLRENVQFKVGNAEGIYLWSDSWYEGGSLEQLPEGIRRLLPKNRSLTMADMINESDGWRWIVGCRFKVEVNSFRRKFVELTKRAEVEDRVEWKHGGKMDIRTKYVYEAIRRKGESKLWNKLIWHKYCILKQSVVAWFLLRGLLEINEN
ncbi:hypothetical protein LIER_29096 [Lithospermum erythrorhizon]|uniref:Reverse transcriptase domain-containing protein n=1 Tax=Lithospermum erythrorhizon TaxID=34254 RepID=A0AAV3RLB2_LITER